MVKERRTALSLVCICSSMWPNQSSDKGTCSVAYDLSYKMYEYKKSKSESTTVMIVTQKSMNQAA